VPPKPDHALTVSLIVIGTFGLGFAAWFFRIGGCGAQCSDPPSATQPVDPSEANVRHTVVFEAESRNGTSSTGNVNYGSGATRIPALDRGNVQLPYRQTVEIVGPVPELAMTVNSFPEPGAVTCRITVDGQVVPKASNSNQVEARCWVPASGHTP
jgi:hypothetical protein